MGIPLKATFHGFLDLGIFLVIYDRITDPIWQSVVITLGSVVIIGSDLKSCNLIGVNQNQQVGMIQLI